MRIHKNPFFRLLAALLCFVMVLSCVPVTLLEADAELLSPEEAFVLSDLTGLEYTHGTVSAWMEYDCGNGIMTGGTNKSYLQVAADTDYSHFSNYCLALSRNADYISMYDGIIRDTSADPVSYARFKAANGSHTVYVYILNALNEVRVIVDTNRDMTGVFAGGYVYESTTGETAQPMITMYGLSMAENGYSIDTGSTQYNTSKVNSGALIIIRMPDNSLFINDGGSVEQWNDENCQRLLTFLRELTGKQEGEKVVINTWFLSHAHSDHFEGFTRFVDQCHEHLDLRNVMYNIDSERLGTARDITYLLQLFRAYYPSVRYFKPHTGEHFDISGIGFDVVYAHEDRFLPTSAGQEMIIDHLDGKSEYAQHGSRNGTYRPECFFETVYSYDTDADKLVATPTTFDYSDFNDTSTVLKVTFPKETTGAEKDYTTLLYGDVNRVDQTMLKVYSGTDMLKADIMLVPHHGHDAHPELVEASGASVFLYTQRRAAIFGPNGIVDYGVDIGGTWSARSMTADEVRANLENLKVRLYRYGNDTGNRTLSYSGITSCYVPVGTARQTVLQYILSQVQVMDAQREACAIAFSGTAAKIGYCWLDADFDPDTASEGTVTVKYRNDDATDTVLATIRMTVG